MMYSSQDQIGAPGEDQFDFGDVTLFSMVSSPSSETTHQNINMDGNDELAKKIDKTMNLTELNTPDIDVLLKEPFIFPSGNESSSSEQTLPMNNIFIQEKMTINNSTKSLDYQEYNVNSPEFLNTQKECFVTTIPNDFISDISPENLNNIPEILVSNIHDINQASTQINILPHNLKSSKRNNNNNKVQSLINGRGNFFDFQTEIRQENIDKLSSQLLTSNDEQHNLLEDSSRYTQKSGTDTRDLVDSFLISENSNTKETYVIEYVVNNNNNNNNNNNIKKELKPVFCNESIDNLKTLNNKVKVKKFEIKIKNNKCMNNNNKNSNNGKFIVKIQNQEMTVKNEHLLKYSNTAKTSSMPVSNAIDTSVPSTSSQQFSVPNSECLCPSRSKRKIKTPLKFEDDAAFTSDEDEEELNPSPKKRGRDSLRGLTPAEKYHRIREQNNAASKKCREKKKLEKLERERELQLLQERNQNLKNRERNLNQKLTEWERLFSIYGLNFSKN